MTNGASPANVAPTEEEMLRLVNRAVEELKQVASRLEAYVGERSPTQRTRSDDDPHWSDA